MTPAQDRPRPLRQRIGSHKKTIAMNNDTFVRVDAFARLHNITWSGALHELVRTHPLIGLPSLLAAEDRSQTLTALGQGIKP